MIRLLAIAALIGLLATPAWADTQGFVVGGAPQKIASAGTSVLLSASGVVTLTTSAAVPASGAAGFAVGSNAGPVCLPLVQDLYLIGGSGSVQVTSGVSCSDASAATATAASSGGLTNFRVAASAGTNATVVKANPGRIYVYTLCNTAATARYMRFFNLATAPVPGTSPVFAGAIAIAAGSCQQFSNGVGLAFPAGIGFNITGAAGDADATAVASGDVQGSIGFQ